MGCISDGKHVGKHVKLNATQVVRRVGKTKCHTGGEEGRVHAAKRDKKGGHMTYVQLVFFGFSPVLMISDRVAYRKT